MVGRQGPDHRHRPCEHVRTRCSPAEQHACRGLRKGLLLEGEQVSVTGNHDCADRDARLELLSENTMSDSQGKPAAADWYYLEEGGSRGPVPASQLRQLVASGVLSPDTLVWREGMTDWLPASELGLTVRAVPPPPPPRSAQQLKEATFRQRERRADGLPAADHSVESGCATHDHTARATAACPATVHALVVDGDCRSQLAGCRYGHRLRPASRLVHQSCTRECSQCGPARKGYLTC